MNQSEHIDYFYSLSSLLTGYNLVSLNGTGQGEFYFKSINKILGHKTVNALLEKYKGLIDALQAHSDKSSSETSVAQTLLQHNKWGPVCRNIIKMWYMGYWYQMPVKWRENYVSSSLDVTQVLSTNSYVEGLVAKAMGRHPKSAKQPGFASWSFPPETPNVRLEIRGEKS